MTIRIALIIGMLLVPDGLRANDSDKAPGLVVMDIQAGKGVSRSAVDVLVDMLVIELRKTHAFGQINSTKDLTELVALEQAKAAMNCNDDNCLAEIGGMLGVPFMLRSQLGKVGKMYVLTLNLISVETVVVVARSMYKIENLEALNQAAVAVVPLLIADYDQRQGMVNVPDAPKLGEPMHVVIKRWKQRAAYVLGGVGAGLYGMAWLQNNNAQTQVAPGPSNINEHALASGIETNRLANRSAATSILFISGGIGLFVWSFFP